MRAILRSAGFVIDRTESSHEQWVCVIGSKPRLVTVDLKYDTFVEGRIKQMIEQSGLGRDGFYCATKSTAKKIGKRATR